MELKAVKYGLDVPDHVTVELVYSNDYFRPIKKDANHPHEGYEFEIKNAFDRGKIVGALLPFVYQDPGENKLVMMTIADIEKRKPDHASPEFWGGEKDKWENGQKVGKEKVEGWYEKMCWKTVYRAAHSDITIDSQKIDDDYLRLKQMESDFAESEVNEEIRANANKNVIDITPPTAAEPQPDPEQPKETAHSSKSNVEPAGQGEMDFEIHPDDIPPFGTEGPDF